MKVFTAVIACALLVGLVASQAHDSEESTQKSEHHVYTFEAPAEQVQVGNKLLTKRRPKLTDPTIPVMTLEEIKESKTPGNSFAEWQKARRDYRRNIAKAVDNGEMTMKEAVDLVRQSSADGDMSSARGEQLGMQKS